MPGPKLTANQLRALAEAADAMRNRPVSLVLRDGGYLAVTTADVKHGDREVLRIETEDRLRPGERHPIDYIYLKTAGMAEPRAVHEVCDALFWSESAVSKFVIPYYARFRPLSDVQALVTAFNRPNVHALGHLPTAESTPMSDSSVQLYTDGDGRGARFVTLAEFLAR